MGMPKAGKSTNIEILETSLKSEHNFQVREIFEGARMCPISKRQRFYYNSWAFHRTVNKIIETVEMTDFDYILVDRGPHDACMFTKALWKNGNIDKKKKEESIQYMKNFRELVDLVVVFMVDPTTSLSREKEYNKRSGRVMNKDFLSTLHEVYSNFCENAPSNHLFINGKEPIQENHELITDEVIEL